MKKAFSVFCALVVGLWSASAWATVDQGKVYKKAYGLDKMPRCAGCHTADKPKKEGDHELNEYGKKVKELAAEPTEETYKQAGPIPAEA